MTLCSFDGLKEHFGESPEVTRQKLIDELNDGSARQFREAIVRVLEERGELEDCWYYH